ALKTQTFLHPVELAKMVVYLVCDDHKQVTDHVFVTDCVQTLISLICFFAVEERGERTPCVPPFYFETDFNKVWTPNRINFLSIKSASNILEPFIFIFFLYTHFLFVVSSF